jgi:hypothetical protein
MTLTLLVLTALSFAALAASVPPPSSPADAIVVDSAADAGDGTLRQALEDAEYGDTITFDPATFPPAAPVTISLTSALPQIHQGNLTLDASDAGVILDGTNVPGTWVACLQVNSSGNTVQGLQISNFSGPGLAIGGAYNQIGGDPAVGAGPHGQGNLTSRNDVGIGMWGTGAHSNTITGNVIGSQLFGGGDSANRFGVEISEGASGNVLGPDNVIAFNDAGVHLHQGANGNVIGPDNEIAYNGGSGIDAENPETLRNTISQNSILDNDGMGIRLSDGANTELAAPAITDFDLVAGTATGTACSDCTLELFSDSSDEGAIYEGQTTADGSGTFTFTQGTPFIGPHLTATATDSSGNTSQFSAPAREPETIVVTSTADSGAGTLRQALEEAYRGYTITFHSTVFPPTAPVTISVASALPLIDQGNLTIDGSNAGVILDGSTIPTDTWVFGLEMTSDGNTVQGLQIVGFPGQGIGLHSGSRDNTIGGDRSVGAAPLGQGNLVSRNGNVGIGLGYSSYNTITGNTIGSDPSGTAAWGNRYNGIYIGDGCSHNQIIGNLIADNGGDGVGIEGSQSTGNVVGGNTIGTDVSGQDPLGNHSCGVSFSQGAGDNTVGPDNVIAYNDLHGVRVEGPDRLGNTITRNSIHHNGDYGINLWWTLIFTEPTLFEFNLQAGTVTGITCPDCKVEIFSDSEDEGAHFEGQTTADRTGAFALSKGAPLIGPHLTATVTDLDGTTSEFSLPTSAPAGSLTLQRGNERAATRFRTRQSRDLLDNRMGGPFIGAKNPGTLDQWLYAFGLKRARVAINHQEPEPVFWDRPEFSIPTEWDAVFTRMADNGIRMKYILTFWDKETYPGGEGLPCPRFKTQAEIDNYLDFVAFIVSNLKDRVEYYEMWNEPDVTSLCTKWIEVGDYIDLVEQTVPVIREEYPEARIVVGAISLLRSQLAQDYLFTMLESDIMPLVDVVSWHPFYSESPEYEATRDYWYAYPSLVQEIKDVATAHGFDGEYQVDELTWWRTGTSTPDQPWEYSPTVAAKYASRAIVMHLGKGIAVTLHGGSGNALYNLSTAVAGAAPATLPFQIQTTVTNTVSYTFALPNDNWLVALWTDGIAAEFDPGITTTLTLPGFTDHTVKAIDVLHSFEQPIIATEEDGALVNDDLLVKDYPVILRISPVVSPTLAQISGPTTGLVDTTYVFTATVDPLSVTVPITYTWQATGHPAVAHVERLSVTDTVTFTWASTGTKTITVTAQNVGGAVTSTHVVTIYEPVVADFVGAPTSGLVPLTVAFNNSSTGDYTDSVWQFGDGLTSTLDSPPHTYTAVGTYTVTLSIAGQGGMDTDTKPAYITVEPLNVYLPLVTRDG